MSNPHPDPLADMLTMPHELDGKFEPQAKTVTTCISDAALTSIAVSMKRIADALDGGDAFHRGDTLSLENEVETMRRHWLEEEARSADLSARLARAVEVMRDTVAVWETCTGGYSYTPVQIERLRAARAFLSEQENRHG